uniref:uncharacterized protein LOC117611105 n=1 Tax=Osmia lignaria TaxID=473952 RepID=UPI001478E962|nr:uncharacterized protein LOC117611105 [Osmia lignaria]
MAIFLQPRSAPEDFPTHRVIGPCLHQPAISEVRKLSLRPRPGTGAPAQRVIAPLLHLPAISEARKLSLRQRSGTGGLSHSSGDRAPTSPACNAKTGLLFRPRPGTGAPAQRVIAPLLHLPAISEARTFSSVTIRNRRTFPLIG